MPNYRRANTKGGTYFFTVVTYRRRKILTLPDSRQALRNAIVKIKRDYPFSIDAWVLLPDHLHCLWTMPDNDADFSSRWGLIKAAFSKQTQAELHQEKWMNESKRKHRESAIWQRRFWEHRIRDEKDYAAHVDYIHFNPVKHGYVQKVREWPYSTFHRFVQSGVHPVDWVSGHTIMEGDEFGE
jgi:putative transposase